MLGEVLEPTEVAIGSFERGDPPPAPYPWLAGPAWWVLRPIVETLPVWIARGTLPRQAREKLGLSWSPAEQMALRALLAGVGASIQVLPHDWRYMPRARAAFQRERWRGARADRGFAAAAGGARISSGPQET